MPAAVFELGDWRGDLYLVTREGRLMGTLVYMAPEQLDGKVATEQSDQFSFCVSLAEALSGVRPFEGSTFSELAVSHAGKASLARAIPSSVRTVLRKGLEPQPGNRFTSMTALLNALERAQFLGWKAVTATVGAAALVCAVIVLGLPNAPAAWSAAQQSVVPLVTNAQTPTNSSEIMAVVGANRSKLRDCVEARFAAEPKEEHGQLIAMFGIGDRGSVVDLRIASSEDSAMSSVLAECVSDAFLSMRFPETVAGQRGIQFPIKF